MEYASPPRPRISFPAVVIATVIAVVLGALLITPTVHKGCGLTIELSNAKQIHQAVYKMVLDGDASGDTQLQWPGDLAFRMTGSELTTGEFVEYLVACRYLDRGTLGKVFSGRRDTTYPEVTSYPGTGPFEGKHSVYTFFKVTATDPDETIFLATKNFHFGAALDPKAPFGERGGTIVRKGGDAQTLNADQAKKKDVGLMPGGTRENPGVQEGNTLKD